MNNSNHLDRVVVTGTPESDLSPILKLAISFARTNQCSLHGLFVEDVDLLRAANLPLTQEVLLSTGKPRPLNTQELNSSINARSQYFRQSLEQHAMQSALSWSFSSTRGHKFRAPFDDFPEAKFLIIAQRKKHIIQSGKIIRIIVIDNQSQGLVQALGVILENVPTKNVEIILVPPISEISNDSFVNQIKNFKIQPERALTKTDRSLLLKALTDRRQEIDYLIASRHEQKLAEQILIQSNCSAIIVP